MAQDDCRPRGCAGREKTQITFPAVPAKAIQSEWVERKRREFGQGVPHKDVYMKIRSVQVRGSRQPCCVASKLIINEQEHGASRCNNDRDRQEVERDYRIESQQMPELGGVIGERRTEKKQRLSGPNLQIRGPTGK